MKTTVLADVPPLDVLLTAYTFYERAAVAGGIDVEHLLDGFREVHDVGRCGCDEVARTVLGLYGRLGLRADMGWECGNLACI